MTSPAYTPADREIMQQAATTGFPAFKASGLAMRLGSLLAFQHGALWQFHRQAVQVPTPPVVAQSSLRGRPFVEELASQDNNMAEQVEWLHRQTKTAAAPVDAETTAYVTQENESR